MTEVDAVSDGLDQNASSRMANFAKESQEETADFWLAETD